MFKIIGCTSGLEEKNMGQTQHHIGFVGTWDTPMPNSLVEKDLPQSPLDDC